MKFYKIRDIGRVISGSTPDTSKDEFWNGDIPWATPKEINKLDTPYLRDTERKLTSEGLKSCSATILPKGSILFTSRAPIGLVAIAEIDVATNQGFKSLQLSKEFYPLYIYYLLKYFSNDIQFLGTGTTFKELSKTAFEDYEVPIPDTLEDQVKIGQLLFKIETIIRKRKENDNLLWNFMQSSFQFFFKDISGPKVPLSGICIINPSKAELKGISDNQEVSFVPMSSITATGDMNVSNVKKLNDVKNGFTYFKNGDVVFAKISPSMENGKGAIATDLKNSLGFGTTEFHVLRPIHGISNAEWLYFLSCQHAFRKMAEDNMTGSAGQQRVNSDFFTQYKTVVPLIERQNEFAKLVKHYYKLKASNLDSLHNLIDFFSALSQGIFQGSLIISDIKIDVQQILNDFAVISTTDFQQTGVSEVNKTVPDKAEITPDNKKRKPQYKGNWDQVATETIANWIKEKYTGYDFNSEMLQRFLLNDHMTFVSYFSSEDLKRTPSLNSREDLRKFLVDALIGNSPFLKIRQHFYDPTDQEASLHLIEDDLNLFKQRTEDENSGIYFTIEEA